MCKESNINTVRSYLTRIRTEYSLQGPGDTGTKKLLKTEKSMTAELNLKKVKLSRYRPGGALGVPGS